MNCKKKYFNSNRTANGALRDVVYRY